MLLTMDPILLDAIQFVSHASPQSLDAHGRSPLHICCQHPSPVAVEILLELQHFNINQMDYLGNTPLLHVIHASNNPCMRTLTAPILSMLLKHGADPNLHGPLTLSPLILAVLQKDEELVELLLRHGANPNIRLEGDKSLFPVRSSALSIALRPPLQSTFTVEDLQIIALLLQRSSPTTVFHAIQKVPRYVKEIVMEMIQLLQPKPVPIHIHTK